MNEDLEIGNVYSVEWVDGDLITKCTFVREHKGFLIFVDEFKNKVFCRKTSIKKLTLLEKRL